MPYWVSSSRVGIQPSPPNPKQSKSKQQKRAERFGRKGITMEDLKKQTALRLAQEQSRQNLGSGSFGNRSVETELIPPSQAAPPREYNNHDSYLDPLSYPSSVPVPSHSNNSYSVLPNPSFAETTQANVQKSKLPHGLTVQELKEMTKARLQAEAASKSHVGEQTAVHSIALRHPTTPESVARHTSRPMPSPLPPGFGHRQDSTIVREDTRQETWDTGNRVLPSDTFLSQKYVSETEFKTGNQFARANVPVDPNLCRGPSMSPRLGLSYPFHEERDVEDFVPRGRAFSSDPVAIHARERTFSSDPYHPRDIAFTSLESRERALSSDTYEPRDRPFVSDPFDAIDRTFPSDRQLIQRQKIKNSAFSTPGNRVRTSSAASMPPISHTSDEFGLDISETDTLRFSSGFSAVREDMPVTPGLADVFRVSSFDKSPLLPSLSQGTEHQDNRMRASTWTAPSMFGACGNISDDLASILKLSGAEDKNLY